jgi:hypothetical protein
MKAKNDARNDSPTCPESRIIRKFYRKSSIFSGNYKPKGRRNFGKGHREKITPNFAN